MESSSSLITGLTPRSIRPKPGLKTEIMIEANTTNSTNYANFPQPVVNGDATSGGNDQFRLREAFVRGGHFLGETQPDAIFRAGARYYRRQHIEIDDFYPLDLSGYGAGVEDVSLGVGKLAVAFLAGARPDITTQNGNYAKSNIDVRGSRRSRHFRTAKPQQTQKRRARKKFPRACLVRVTRKQESMKRRSEWRRTLNRK
jgi:hypothetical protein